MIKLNLGCGQIRPEGWINTDSSFNSFLQQYFIGKVIAQFTGSTVYASKNAMYMNLNKRWKIKDGSVDIVYASHLLEHLSMKSSRLFLTEAIRTLKPGGVIRIVVPDLFLHARKYVKQIEAGNTEASVQFLWAINLHKEGQYPDRNLLHDLLGWLQGWPHQHKYMYDKYSLSSLFASFGFSEIIESSFGISNFIDNIQDVEDPTKGGYENSLYLEAIKP